MHDQHDKLPRPVLPFEPDIDGTGGHRGAHHRRTGCDRRPGAAVKDLIDEIKTKAPNAEIVFTGYPHVISTTAAVGAPCSWLLWPAQIAQFAAWGDQLNTVIQNATTAKGVSFAPTAAGFNGHEACSSDEYINAIIAFSTSGSDLGGLPQVPGAGSFHPKPSGVSVYTSAVLAAF